MDRTQDAAPCAPEAGRDEDNETATAEDEKRVPSWVEPGPTVECEPVVLRFVGVDADERYDPMTVADLRRAAASLGKTVVDDTCQGAVASDTIRDLDERQIELERELNEAQELLRELATHALRLHTAAATTAPPGSPPLLLPRTEAEALFAFIEGKHNVLRKAAGRCS